jgi:hypothetical protein
MDMGRETRKFLLKRDYPRISHLDDLALRDHLRYRGHYSLYQNHDHKQGYVTTVASHRVTQFCLCRMISSRPISSKAENQLPFFPGLSLVRTYVCTHAVISLMTSRQCKPAGAGYRSLCQCVTDNEFYPGSHTPPNTRNTCALVDFWCLTVSPAQGRAPAVRLAMDNVALA